MRTPRFRSNLLFAAGVLLGGLLILPSLFLAVALRRWVHANAFVRRDRWQAIVSFMALGLLCYGALWRFLGLPYPFVIEMFHALRGHAWSQLLSALVSLWLMNVLLAPAMTLVLEGCVYLSHHRFVAGAPISAAVLPPEPLAPAGMLPTQTSAQASSTIQALPGIGAVPVASTQARQALSAQVSVPLEEPVCAATPSNTVPTTYYYGGYHTISVAPAQVNGLAVIGHPRGGDLDWIEGGWFAVSEDVLREHGVISGGSGSGKTSFAMRLASLVRSVYGWRVYYVDAKADDETAVQFVTEMNRLGTAVRVFPNEPLDGWRGTSAVLRNRLMQLLTYSESFYKDGARLLVGLALNAPGGIPRSSDAFLHRLNPPVLEALYKRTANYGKVQRIDPVHFDGTMVRFESFFTSAGTLLDGSWSWEDTPAAYLALDSLGQQDDSQALGRFLIEDFGHFIKYRKPPDERVLLILDEFSALADDVDVANLFQRIRSSGGSVFVIIHGDASIKTQAQKLFQACANIIVFQSNDPMSLIQHAGTRLVPDVSHYRPKPPDPFPDGKIAPVQPGGSTLRMKEHPKIHPNDARKLSKGEGFWIWKGQMQRLLVEVLRQPAEALAVTQQRILPLQPPAASPVDVSSRVSSSGKNKPVSITSRQGGSPPPEPLSSGDLSPGQDDMDRTADGYVSEEDETKAISPTPKKARGLFDV